MLTVAAGDALGQPGCPLCRLEIHQAVGALEAILWEQATDPETSRQLVEARGYCFEHGWALLTAAERVWSRHGVALLLFQVLQDLVRTVERRGLGGARAWVVPRLPCPICTGNGCLDAAYAREVARLYLAEPDLVDDTPAVLCRRHREDVLARAPDDERPTLRGRIERRQRAALAV
ncbi:MAG: hypothetical protein IRY97_08895, partial [Thermomicrobiaceae bacterium]|nr:hypothetical protein [Thermomicrobiaceae bacterium]